MSLEILDVKKIKPGKGVFSCNLWENAYTGLPLTLFYAMEIPLEPFDSGHTYVDQPTSTSIVIEWIKFTDEESGQNEPNWKNLVGNEYSITYDDGTGEGSIYLGDEHCLFNANIRFLSLNNTTFDIELTLAVDFNIETVNLDADGNFTIRTQLDYEGLLLYDNTSLPSFTGIDEPMGIISKFIDGSVYEESLVTYPNPDVQWRQLRPKA